MNFDDWWNDQEWSKEKPGIPGALVMFFREMCERAYSAGACHVHNKMSEKMEEIWEEIE